MRILILNGSPAGENSITLQTMHYVQKYFPKQEYRELHVGQRIRAYEKDFSAAREELEAADLIVFCYPVYTFLVPAQLHRFVELMKESGIDFRGKYATQVSTSKHFYDVTAHEFIKENACDMGMSVIRGLSADMEDLLGPRGQREAREFFRHLLWVIRLDRGELSVKPAKEDQGRKIVVVADLPEGNEALPRMIREFEEASPYPVSVVSIREFPFAGGCLGCFHCASDGKCIYKDRFDDFLREKIQTADACVYAFKIKDHSMGQRFKLFDDRQFCNGHRTVTMGKPVGYLIDGDYEREANLRMLIEARSQVGGNYLAGVAVHGGAPEDKPGDGNGEQEAKMVRDVRTMAAEIAYCIRRRYNLPADFYGVGGMKIFRDLIYQMQGMMREDHRFYKEHGFYDFPQRHKGKILGMYLVGAMMNNKTISRKMGGNLTKGMLMPYRSVIDKAGPREKAKKQSNKKERQESSREEI